LKDVVPPTDSRRRMDMRLMEEGKFREAEREKNRLEDEQRTRQKVRDESGT
jgi:hypothetical protein